jgi:hypothetical protein
MQTDRHSEYYETHDSGVFHTRLVQHAQNLTNEYLQFNASLAQRSGTNGTRSCKVLSLSVCQKCFNFKTTTQDFTESQDIVHSHPKSNRIAI